MSVNYLIIGLGNHGNFYQNHKHNIGYIIIDAICKELNILQLESKFSSSFATYKIARDYKFFFIKPETYMNNSGVAIQQFKNFYKILDNKNIFVIHDELDLHPGKCKIKCDGGDAGHNGIKSIDLHCKKDYWRLRVGVGRPIIKDMAISDFVLSNLSKEEILYAQNLGKFLVKNLNNLFIQAKHSIILNEISKI